MWLERRGFYLLSILCGHQSQKKTGHENLFLGDFITAFQYIKETYKKNREKLFTRVCSDRMRGKGSKMKLGRLRLDTIKKFFTMWVVGTGTCYPEKLQRSHHWNYSRPGWMRLGTTCPCERCPCPSQRS